MGNITVINDMVNIRSCVDEYDKRRSRYLMCLRRSGHSITHFVTEVHLIANLSSLFCTAYIYPQWIHYSYH